MDKIRPMVQPLLAPAQPLVKPVRHAFAGIVASGFLLSVSTALSAYIHSSFLKTIVPESVVGYVFTLASALTFFAIHHYWRLIARWGNHATLLVTISVQMLCAILLASPINGVVSVIAFLGFLTCSTVSIVNFDLWMEPLTRNEETGRVRGVFWTATNLGFLLSPLITGRLTQSYGFGPAYLASAVALIPAWIIIFLNRKGKDSEPVYRPHQSARALWRRVAGNRDLRGIFLISTMLFAFYSLMVIYSPLYLVRAGMRWDQIGVMFTIMLVPFVLIEYPAGWLADRYLGETEMLTLGFALIGIFTLLMLKADSFWELTLALFFTRVGASFVEIMRETYFYKKVDAEEIELIEAFRNTVTIAYVGAPLIASFCLLAGVNLTYILTGLGIAMIFCTGIPVTMEDTK